MKHPDDLTPMWRKIQELQDRRLFVQKVKEELKRELEIKQKSIQERTEDGRLPPTR